jgi:hypothetical protein
MNGWNDPEFLRSQAFADALRERAAADPELAKAVEAREQQTRDSWNDVANKNPRDFGQELIDRGVITTPAQRYNLNYGPGGEASWGTPASGPGGNQQFYQQQFNNLVAQQQNHNEAEIVAALRSKAAQNAPPQTNSDPWGWVPGGLNEGYPWDINPSPQPVPPSAGASPTVGESGGIISDNPAQTTTNLALMFGLS